MSSTAFSQRLRASGIWAAAGRILSGILLLILHGILARSLSQQHYGQYVLIESLALVGSLICMAGIPPVMLRLMRSSLAIGDEKQSELVAGSAIKLLLLTSAMTICGSALLAHLYQDRLPTPLPSRWAGIFLTWAVLAAALRVLSEIYRARDIYSVSYAIGGQSGGLLVNVSLVGIAVAMICTNRMTVSGMLLVQIIIQLAVLLLCLEPVLKTWQFADAPTMKVLAVCSLPILLQQLISIGLPELGKLLLGAYASPADTGMYNAALRLVILAHVPLMVVNNAIAPFISELHAAGRKTDLSSLLRGSATFAAIPCLSVLLVFLAVPELVLTHAFGPDFVAAAMSLRFLALGSLIWVLSGSCGLVLMMSGHERSAMVGTLVPGLIYLVTCPWLVAEFGLTGAGVAAMLLQVFSNTLCVIFARLHCGLWTFVTTNPATLRSCLQMVSRKRPN